MKPSDRLAAAEQEAADGERGRISAEPAVIGLPVTTAEAAGPADNEEDFAALAARRPEDASLEWVTITPTPDRPPLGAVTPVAAEPTDPDDGLATSIPRREPAVEQRYADPLAGIKPKVRRSLLDALRTHAVRRRAGRD